MESHKESFVDRWTAAASQAISKCFDNALSDLKSPPEGKRVESVIGY